MKFIAKIEKIIYFNLRILFSTDRNGKIVLGTNLVMMISTI